MENTAEHIRRHYLDRLDDSSWEDDEPYLDFGITALPFFVDAFNRSAGSANRERLLSIIWRSRSPTVIPILAEAVRDMSQDVWKTALDGLVALGGTEALTALLLARSELTARGIEAERLSWINEAIQQIRDEEKKAENGTGTKPKTGQVR